MGKHQEDGYEFHELDSTELDKLMKDRYQSHFERSLEQLAGYLIHYPDKIKDFKDEPGLEEVYDKLKDVDWESACHAHYDSENKCLVITFPSIAEIKID
jgi:hypothetical protein